MCNVIQYTCSADELGTRISSQNASISVTDGRFAMLPVRTSRYLSGRFATCV